MSVKGKLLIVEDSLTQGAHLSELLERIGYQVIWAHSGMEALKAARLEEPDLILLDVVMGDMDGFSVCRWLRMSPETRDIPIIMLTVKGLLSERVEGLNVGANDYLPKPFADEELEARIFAALRVRAAETELRQRNVQLESMLQHVEGLAITDPLTSLFNRRRFSDVLRREFAVTKRYGHPLSCIIIDVDHFKRVNDSYGHQGGDQILSTIAHRLTQNLREVDLAARYGGEEFAILLPQTPKPGAMLVAERILEVVRSKPVTFDGGELKMTISGGVASTEDVAGSNPDDLVKAADTALYQAKAAGRDRVVAFEQGSDLPQPS